MGLLVIAVIMLVIEVDGGDGKLVKKLLKSRKIVKKSEKPQRSEKLQRSLVQRNIYQSTDSPSKNSSFRFCLAQKALSRPLPLQLSIRQS